MLREHLTKVDLYQIKQFIKHTKVSILVLLVVLFLPLLLGQAEAAQITSRSLTISSALVSASSVSYTFGFKFGTAGQVQGVKFQACTTALGTCTAPTGLSFSSAAAPSKTGFAGSTNFTVDGTGANDCTASASILCIKRTDATSEDTTTAKTLDFASSITNPSGASCAGSNPNCTFFVRMTTYTTSTWTGGSIVDTGTVASSTVATITISASVAEVLNLCIGSTSINNATSTTGSDCSAISGTTVGLGTLQSSNTNVSPVSSNNGNNLNGVAMLRTNANGGAIVQYRAIQQTGTNHQGTLRVLSATCNAGVVNTDQCVDAKGTSQGTFTAGTENFGMTVAAINCGSTTAYTCTYSSGTYNLTRDAQYDGTGANTYPTDSDLVGGTTNAGYAWDESGTFDQIASSTGPVDDEALILKFAATPNQITPTGSYQAQADFIAICTY